MRTTEKVYKQSSNHY